MFRILSKPCVTYNLMELRPDDACAVCSQRFSELFLCVDCQRLLCFPCAQASHPHSLPIEHVIIQIATRKPLFVKDSFIVKHFALEAYRDPFAQDIGAHKRIYQQTFALLRHEAQQGNGLVSLSSIASLVSVRASTAKEEVQRALWGSSCPDAICLTLRGFGMRQELYASLRLSALSVEALLWIVKSARNDCLEPNIALLHSRLKEFFHLRPQMKDLRAFINALLDSPALLHDANAYREIIDEL